MSAKRVYVDLKKERQYVERAKADGWTVTSRHQHFGMSSVVLYLERSAAAPPSTPDHGTQT